MAKTLRVCEYKGSKQKAKMARQMVPSHKRQVDISGLTQHRCGTCCHKTHRNGKYGVG
eukprot:m.215040 g.215040  ORF g.215040 m.215040 type:complete len:58 (+) comp15874_c0_seq4:907-1080(+)